MDTSLKMVTRNRQVQLSIMTEQNKVKSDFLREIIKNILFGQSLLRRVKNK